MPPAGPWQPPPGGPPPRRRIGGRVLSVVVVFAVIVAGLAVTGLIRWTAGRATDAASAEPVAFAVGGCVRISAQPSVVRSVPNGPVLKTRSEYAAVGCSDKSAYAKITLIRPVRIGAGGLAGGATAEGTGCAVDTDDIVQVRSGFEAGGRTACLRRLAAPHPGDPGGGGGLVRQGDCVQVLDRYTDNVREAPCTDKDWTAGGVRFGKEWFGQIVGRAETVNRCPTSAIYNIRVRSMPLPVLCLAKNGGWLPAAGDCVDANLIRSVAARRPCGDGSAMKITALVPPGQACPGGAAPRPIPGYIPRVCFKRAG